MENWNQNFEIFTRLPLSLSLSPLPLNRQPYAAGRAVRRARPVSAKWTPQRPRFCHPASALSFPRASTRPRTAGRVPRRLAAVAEAPPLRQRHRRSAVPVPTSPGAYIASQAKQTKSSQPINRTLAPPSRASRFSPPSATRHCRRAQARRGRPNPAPHCPNQGHLELRLTLLKL